MLPVQGGRKLPAADGAFHDLAEALRGEIVPLEEGPEGDTPLHQQHVLQHAPATAHGTDTQKSDDIVKVCLGLEIVGEVPVPGRCFKRVLQVGTVERDADILRFHVY